MEPYGWYVVVALGFLSLGFLWVHLADRAQKKRIKMCEWMERADPFFDAIDQQAIRNKKLFAATVLVCAALFLLVEFRHDLPLMGSLGAETIIGGALFVWAFWAIPYGLLPLLMPEATAVSDVVSQSGLKQGDEAEKYAKALLVKADINRALEAASERTKTLWVRATRAIVANDGSVSAQNREIADLDRCNEAGAPLPKILENAARGKREQRVMRLLDMLDDNNSGET